MSYFHNVPVVRWTNGNCVAWIESLSSGSNVSTDIRVALLQIFNSNDFTGDDLLDFCQSSQMLVQELLSKLPRIKPSQAKKVCVALRNLQKSMSANPSSTFNAIVMVNNNNNYNNNCNNNYGNNNYNIGSKAATITSKSFTVMIDKGQRTIKIPNMTSQKLVSELKKAIFDKEGWVGFSLLYHIELNDNITLGSYGIGADTVVRLVLRVGGGTTSMAVNRRHISYSRFPNIKKTRKADCLFGFTFAEGYSVAEMPCGHVMEAEAMHKYIESKIAKNLYSKIVIECPLPKCQTVWDFPLCCRVAGMSDEEYVKMTRIKEIRGRDDFRECPNCNTVCKRKTDVAILRVKCQGCKGRDWCWVCGNFWKGSSLMVCNNSKCPFVASLNEELSSCDSEVPFGWENVIAPAGKTKKLPNIRACPGCLQLIFKPQGCKHITCGGCSKKFCFACLKSQSACLNKHYKKYCEVHPIQHFS